LANLKARTHLWARFVTRNASARVCRVEFVFGSRMCALTRASHFYWSLIQIKSWFNDRTKDGDPFKFGLVVEGPTLTYILKPTQDTLDTHPDFKVEVRSSVPVN
jgi:hypothetical protein